MTEFFSFALEIEVIENSSKYPSLLTPPPPTCGVEIKGDWGGREGPGQADQPSPPS